MMLFSLARHLVLSLLGFVFFFPFLWMFLSSLKHENEIFQNTFFPHKIAFWENYTKVLDTGLLMFLCNGALVCLAILLLQILIAYPCAYALSKHEFVGKRVVFNLIVLCLLIPTQAVCVPWYLMMHKFGWLDSYAALILPFSISVFGIFLIRQFINTLPTDLIYAAKMDGLSEWSIIWRIIFPLTLPAFVSFGIFSVVAHWNDYFWPLIAVSSPQYFTPTLGIVGFRNNEAGTQYALLMAAACIVILPLIVGFLLAQKRFIQGVAHTGIK